MSAAGSSETKRTPRYLQVAYILLNTFASCAIVFVNKVVFTTYGFKFVTTLSLIHTIITFLGMHMMMHLGFFESAKLGLLDVAPLAFGYVGYVVLSNLSLKLNTVGLFQILKVAIAPTVILLEFVLFRKLQTYRVLAAVTITCVGVAAAVVTDRVAISNLIGLCMGLGAVVVTAMYQIWAGSKQKELHANSSQLLLAYTPQAICLLLVLAPMLDDVGLRPHPGPHTVIGYRYTPSAIAVITLSGLLGVLVTLSTFLVIGATSSLTFNIVGHLKTVLILMGGCLVFGEAMPLKRLLGVMVTMAGIIWYTVLLTQQQQQTPTQTQQTKEEQTQQSSGGDPTTSGEQASRKSGGGAKSEAAGVGHSGDVEADGHREVGERDPLLRKGESQV